MATTPKQMDLVPRQRPRDIMADRVREQLEKSTERMKALFATADLLQDRTLNVEVFRINFLPYFCGELAWTDEFKQAWQAVAGTFLNPVNLWDENNAVVVVVPPMVDTNVIQSVGRDLDAPRHATVRDVARSVTMRCPRVSGRWAIVVSL